jgi:hypothetical protein
MLAIKASKNFWEVIQAQAMRAFQHLKIEGTKIEAEGGDRALPTTWNIVVSATIGCTIKEVLVIFILTAKDLNF